MQNHELPEDLKAVIFDFDGTLADSYAAIAASVNHVRGHHHLPPLSIAEVQRHVGRGPGYLLEHTVGSDDETGDQALYRAHHPSVMAKLTHLLPGASEVLAAVKRTNRRTAICSNKPRTFTAKLLTVLEIGVLVDLVIGPEDVAHPKPAPDMLLLALTRLGIRSEQALYVGDMTVDIQSARAAGISVWVVPTGSDTREALEQASPDRLLADLLQLAEFLCSKRS